MRSAHRHNCTARARLFAAALLALSAALALPAAAQTMTDPVWSATMTAGDTQVGHGYDATDTPDTPAIGALDDDDFDYESLPYRVLAIDVTPNVVRFAVAPGGQLANKPLTLEFGGHALAFSDLISAISVGVNFYWLVPAALDDLETEFPVGSTATVCLRTATQVCPTGSIVTPPAAGVSVSKAALTVTEQDTTGDSYTVVLDTEPTHDVTVTVDGHSGTDVSLSASTLTFTPSNWDRAQTVTVTALNDDDTADDAVTLTHTATSTDDNYSGITIAGVSVTVTDNDTTTPTVTLVLSAASIGEDGGVSTVSATVSPASAAAFTVTVVAAAVSPAVAADFRLSANRVLSFAENATASTGSVTITGVDNDVDATDKTVTVSGTVSATSVTVPANRTLTLEDDDAAGVSVSKAALTVTEQDTTGDSYTVVLDTEPTHDVTVTVDGHSGTDVSLSASTLTFTPSNWDRAQTVTVTALNDDDTADDAVTLTHTATSTDDNYSGITIAGVSVTVTDNDTTTPTVTLVLSAASIGEDGGVSTVSATVSPASAAAFTVTVVAAAVSPAVAADFRLSANRVLSFAENATASTGSVTITGVDNDVDATDKTVTVSGTVSATSVTVPANRTLTLEDDDAAGVSVSKAALTVTEQDTTGDSYTVVLDTEPTHDVTVTVDGHAGTDVSLSASTLTFTPSNWDRAQTVTVTALNDDDTADDAVTLTHTATSTDDNYSGITIAGVSVTVTDNDTTTPTVTLVLSAASIGEDGGVSTVSATVSPASAAAFTVTVVAAAVSPAVAADFRLSANRVLSFAENATASTGSVTITGVDNDVDATDKTVTVSGTVSATSVTVPANRTLTLEDDDAAGVSVSKAALTVTEQDTTGDSYTVVLDTEPTHDVTVTVDGHSGTDVSLSASTLTFTPSNWDRAQTVTVTALNDDDTADDAVTLTHTATSTDDNYSGITIAGVSVTVTDNDTTTPTVTLVLSAASIGEDGGVSTVSATVSPASAAAFTVTVVAAAVSPAVAADFRLSANRVLSFAENATASTGSVTITGVDNDVDATDKTVTVSGTVSATSVTVPANRTLTLEDDDAAGVSVSKAALTVTEQDTTGDSYTVVLDTEPTHDVTVTVDGHSGTDVSLSASTLTFTPSNWDRAQTVTVTALNDDDTADDAVTLTHTATSTDDNYSGITIAGVSVTVTDNDTTTPTVTLVLSAASIGEDGGVSTVSATVSPASAAAFTVTVVAAAVSPAVAADFRLSANRVLSFAENATASTGSVTITGVDNDVDATDKTVTVSGTVSATSVTVPANRTLTLEDDDAAGVSVSKAALTVTEQDTTGDSYTVVLDTEPTHDVTVTVDGHSGTDVSLSASTLTFTPSNWDRAQTVTVTALNDDDTADDAVTLTHTATSTDDNYSGITIAGVSVTVTDNDTTTPTVTLVLSAASIGEDGGVSTVSATVSPASAAAFTVTVVAAAVSPAVAADFRLSANRVLSFAENATASTGSVTITGVDNDVDATDKTVTVSGTVSATSVTVPANRTLTLEDDDAAGVSVSKAALTVTEQDTTGDSYTVVLDTEPTHDVTVTVDGHSGTDVSLSASTLTFTPSNWDRAQTVTVTALNDDDTADDAVTLTHTATSTDDNYSGITIAGVSVTVTDNDTTTPTVTLVLSAASIGEDGGVSTVSATVSPASAAAFTVTVVAAAVSPAVAADFRLSANRVLSFAENATASTGSVTITGVDNDVDATDKTVTVSGTVSATSVTVPANRTLTLEDDDAAGVSVSKAALTVTEQDTTGDSYTVVLDTEPTHDVTVTVDGHSGTDVSLSASTLTFTPSNWDRAQTVTVTALNDDDTADDAVTLTHTATSTDDNYSGITIAGVSVTVTDNDTTTPTVTLVLSAASIGEDGGVSTVSATVSPASAAAFTVTVAAAAVSPAVAADFRLSANRVLSFAENATASTGSVTITGVDNDVDATDKTVTVSGTVSATSVTVPANRTLTLEDDDAAGVSVSKAALTVTEQDTTGDSYTVVLDTEPTHDVTVTVDGHSGTDVSLSASTLTFTPSNWDRAQTVTVTALNDDDTADDAVTLTHTATSTDDNYSGITIAGVSVTVTDNDTTTPTVTLVLSAASIGEDGGVSTVSATVSPASAAAFTVTVVAAAVSPAVAADFRLSANRVLSFAENATASTGSVTITGVDNDVDATDKTVTVSGTVSATSVTVPANRTLTLEDDDAAGVSVSKAALTVTEQDTTGDSYTVVLDTEPTHDVTVTVDGHAGTDVSLSASTLTFTPSNWDRAQTVTVTALNDDDTADDAVTLTHTATSTDDNYSGITIAGVSVTVTDNDTTTPTVTLVLSAASIGEDGGVSTVSATVSPASAAAFTVTVVAAAVSPAVAADFRLSANRVLSFAENATASTGSVTITGVDNDVDATDKTVTVSGTVSATSVTVPANRTLTLEDDDVAGVSVSKAALTVTEQDTTGDSYTVVLDTEPTHDVTVTVDGHSGTDVSLSASTLTFTPSNWDRAQTVTVTALNDDDTADDAVTLTHTATSTDDNYSGITIAGVSVTVTDNDTTTPTVTLVLSAASIGEDGGVSTVSATVSPASAAAFTVTVVAAAVSPAVAADFRLSANRVLSFAENATASTGSVTITGVDNDVDATDKTVTVSGTVSATSVTVPANRTLTLEDDDAAGVSVSKAALTVTEQDTTGDSYTVVLDTEPTHDVTVTVDGHSGTDVSLSASTLTFTPSNWDRAQTVTVTALNDDDTADDAVTLTHTATSTDDNYSGITIAGVSVTVTDNDTTTPTVTLVLSAASIGEDGGVSTVSATVSPASAAAFTVTVVAAAVSPAVAADFRLSANRVLSFAENATASTGSVTITGVDNDVDATDKTVTVSGTVSATSVTVPANRTLTLEDDDAAGVSVSKAALTVTEQDTTGDSYTVVLDTEPTHDVTVTVDGHAGTDVSLSASTLTFTPSNWDRAQTVTVTALNDDDTADDAVTLTHTATSTDDNYSGITIAGVSVTVTDNDTTTPTVTLVLSAASIGEDGGVSTVSATVSPASAAAFTVTVVAAAVSPAVAADFRLSANRVLSFAENATASTGSVTITGVDNDVDATDKTVTVSGTVSATSVTVPANRTLTLEDDDVAGVSVSKAALTVTEQDTTGDSYTVVLDTEPTHDVTVTVDGHSGTDVSLSASTLTFTPSNWDRAQTVTVTALNDDDTADDAVTLTHTATSTDDNYSGITIAGVSVTVTDNDTTTPTVTLVLSAASIGEDGGVSTVSATVSPASAAAFTVTVAAAAVSPAVAADFRLSANQVLSFAENATASTGSVTITGVDNDVDATDKTVTVSGTVSATSVTVPATRTLTLEDDDAAGVSVSKAALTVTEQDTTGDSYTVVLDTEPTHDVTVTVGGHSGTDVSLSASTLTFTPSNWDRTQTVTVTALNDDDTANDAVTLTHTATSTDGNYSGIAIAGVSVTVTDNDTTTPTVTLVLSAASIGENGGVSTVTATVSPASAAAFTMTVAAAAVSPAVAADFRLSANQVLSFAENATASTGSVTITGVDNDVDATDKTVTVSGTVSATSVTVPANRTLTLEDDDAAGVSVSKAALTVTEQDTTGDSYTVVLDTEPTHDVTVTVDGHSGTDVSLSASTLTFTPSNWDRTQTVTVTALNDDDTANDAVTLTHTATSTDGNYSGIAIAGVSVTVTDNDTTTPTVTLVLSDGSIGENGGISTVTATVSPASAAAFTMTVAAAAVSPAVAADFRLSANQVLSFAENATASTGSVTITGVDNDVDATDKTVTVSGTVSATSVTVPANRTLTLEDDDAAGVSVSKAALTVTEQDTTGDSYTVVLDTEPTHDVTVTVGGHSGTDVSLSASTLTFTPSNWDRTQTVTVTALNDDDTANDAVTLTHTATSTDGNYSGIAIAGVAVTVTDNDTMTPTVTLVLSDASIGENGGVSTVTATVSPASPVAFTVEISASPVAPATDDDFELSTNRTLSFAANATGSTGTVRISPVSDEDPEPNDVVTVSGVVSNPAIPNPDDVRLTILNDDGDLPQDIAIDAPAAVDEGAGTANVTVTLTTRQNTAPVIDAQLFYRPRPETATHGDDYTRPQGPGNRIAIVPVSEFSANADGTAWVARHSFEIGIVDDGEAERDETIVFEIYSNSDNSGTKQTIRIRDNDTPVMRNVRVVNGPGAAGMWSAGEQVELEVRYTLPVAVEQPSSYVECWSYNADGTCKPPGPYVAMVFRSDARPGYGEVLGVALARYVSGSRTATLRFAYTVGTAEAGARGVEVVDGKVLLRGATIRPLGGGNDVGPEFTRTRVMRVDVQKPGGGAWTAGDKVRVTVKFTGPGQQNLDTVRVRKTGGTPTIGLRLGDPENRLLARTASYEGGSNSNTLSFEYAVTARDGRISAVEVVADSLAKNGATIRNKDGYDAELDHLGVVWFSSLALRVRDTAAPEGGTLRFTMELAQASKAPVTVDYETADGTATAGEDYTAKRGTVTFAPGHTRKTVAVPVLRDEAAEDTETVVLRLSNVRAEGSEEPVEVTDPEAEGTIEDGASEGLTASFEGLPEAHDGESAFTFRIAFSERIGWMNGQRLREHVVAVAGGRATSAGRVDRRRDLWQVTVEPDSTADVTVTLSSGAACRTPAAVCTSDGRALSNTISTTVAGPDVAPANTPAEGVPAIDGEARVGGTLTASTSGITDADGLENATFAYQWIRGGVEIPGATGSDYTAVDADEGERLQVRVGFADDAGNAESLTSAATQRVAAPRALPKVLAADARAREGEDATLDFAVTLSAPAPGLVTVDYRTLDASAKAGEDYGARSGTLSFAPGETAKTVAVPVLDDALDEGTEILVLRFENVRGAVLADRFAVGRIENTDPMPKAWLARFGRTVSGQVLDAVEERLRASRTAGVTVSVAGQTIDLTAQPNVELETENETQARLPALSDWLRQETDDADRAGMQPRTVTLAELLMGSSFTVAGETNDGSSAAVWGRMAQSSFSGREAGLSLDGDVTTGLLGADYARGPWTGGAVLSHSSGEGDYSGEETGKVKASITAMTPWAGYRVSDRLSVWAALGYGTGDLTLTPKNPLTQEDLPAKKTDIAMTLAAAGARGTLVDGDGPKLDAVADARWVRTTSEQVTALAENGGNLQATQANVTRVRLGLEGSWAMALDDKGTTLTPRFSFGVRRDGGDAETGFGADIGGGLTFAMPASGLMLSLQGRGLIIHEADGLSDTGYQASIGYDPAPSSNLGLSLSLHQSFGGSATGGKDALFSREVMDGLAANGNDGGSQRLEGKIGYGMPVFGDRFTGTPEFGFAVSRTERAYSLGWRLSREGLDAGTFQSSLEATRRESANDNDPEHGIGFRFTARF